MTPDLWLELGAKFTILASLLIIIYFFTFTTWRITRLPTTGWPLFHLGGWGRQELHQRPTSLPFTFTLCDLSLNQHDSFKFRLTTTTTSHHTPSIKALWGVDASHLFKLINSPSWEYLRELEDSSTPLPPSALEEEPWSITNYVLHIQTLLAERIANYAVEASEMEFEVRVTTPPQMDWSLLNGQYRYPLALFFQTHDVSPPPSSEADAVVGLCVILHVKSSIIPRPTAVLAQYIKLADGRSHKLQPLYVMDGGDLEERDQQPRVTSEPFGAVVCSVCQTLPVSRAIVPCGHVCLCAQCFGKVGNCPICRGPITYFFKTRNENYIPSG